MNIVFHERYKEVYASDPAATQNRLNQAFAELKDYYPIIEPYPAGEKDILRVHTEQHLNKIKKRTHLYEIACLSAGGAITSAQMAWQGSPSFGLIRPPGHHASPNSCWGFCWFNNIAIALENLRSQNKLDKSIIIDIDLHFGDGTNNIYASDPEVSYQHLDTLNSLQSFLAGSKQCDIVGISAGFDRHINDWGRKLKTKDYTEIGKIIGDFAVRICQGKIFAVLEGGYNHKILGEAILALLEGLEQ